MLKYFLPSSFFLILSSLFTLSLQQGLNLTAGFLTFATPPFAFQLVKTAHVLASLKPSSSNGFDFSPLDMLQYRANNGQYHTGDITFRARTLNSSTWITGDSAALRNPVVSLNTNSNDTNILAASNLSPTLSSEANELLNITRSWKLEDNKHLLLSFELTNVNNVPIEVGALGFPIEFNSILTNRNSDAMYGNCSFTDPAIASDGGYLRVTRLNGDGPALVITPIEETPLDAWVFLEENTADFPYYQSQTFEGLYSWTSLTAAYDEEWGGVKPWNPLTSKLLESGGKMTVGLRLSVAEEIREIEEVLEEVGNPVVVGIPGYVVPQDLEAKLFMKYGKEIESITQDPTGAFAISMLNGTTSDDWSVRTLSPTGAAWGRVRLAITFADNKTHTVQYYITKSAPEALSDLGNFLFTEQWFTNTSDPFGRAPSVISYDRSVNAQVLQDPRVWIPGLSDEGGAGSFLAAAMKNFVQPNAEEIQKLDRFVNETVWGGLQFDEGGNMFGVRPHVFFYDPTVVPRYEYDPTIDWTQWWSYNYAHSLTDVRAYNYVHVIATYFALWRTAKTHPEIPTIHDAAWYLVQAVQTILFMGNEKNEVGYVEDGLMGETVFEFILQDVLAQGNTSLAADLENFLKERAEDWAASDIPFGSEMAWDSTGQEGVYLWTDYYGFSEMANKTLNAILGYTPAVPHWGWNGNARRYWDNIYAGKLQRIERQIHHYGSALNSLPLLRHFRSNPEDFYSLRVGHAGISAPLTNIDEGGFAAASFHSWPQTLQWDAYSGDYESVNNLAVGGVGPGFSGMAMGAGCYAVEHPDFGWVAFGGNLNSSSNGDTVTIEPRDSVRRRVYIASLGLWMVLDAGAIQSVNLDTAAGLGGVSVTVEILPAVPGFGEKAPSVGLNVSQPAAVAGVGVLKPVGLRKRKDGLWGVEFSEKVVATVEIASG